MAIDLTCDVSSKRITPGVINLKEFENGTTSMIWTVSSRYTTGLVDLNDFDAYLILSVRGHIDQIKLTKVLNADDSISLTWDVGTLSTFLVGYAKYQIVFKAMGSGSLYVTCPTDANANGTYTVQNPEAIQSLRTYINDHNYRIFIGSSGKWTLENTSAVTVAYKLIESVLPSGDNWNNCTVADTTATVFNTYEALMYVSESIASDPSMMAQFPTMLRQWELLLSDKIMSSGLNAVRYEVTEAMFTANSGPGSTYFLKLEDIDTTGKPGLIIGAEAFQLEGYGYYTQIANCNFSDNWAGSAGITVPEAFNGYVVVYYSEGGGRWVDTRERIAEVIEHDYSLSGNGTFATPLGINNPLQYVKGNTDYGGTLTDNLNTLVRNTPFTCLGTATGVPDASYSWFGWHINSNTGTTAAYQRAIAYNSASILCYERVKTSSAWGAWILQGSGVGAKTYETWYLDPVNGLDTNSGMSRSAPKKTGDAVVIACKTAGKIMGRLVVMAGSNGVVFNANAWSDTTFPFSDVVFETAYTECTWNGITGGGIFKVFGGKHTFNVCTYNGESSVKAEYCTINGGTWSGTMNFDIESYMTVNGMTSLGLLCIQTPSLEIQSNFVINGTAKIQADEFFGAGNFRSFAISEVYLDIQTNHFSFEGIFQFPSQAVNSFIKITAAKMARTATTKLLFLGAEAGVTVNYQLVVDTMGSIVPMKIGNPAGTVAGKVIELLKYGNEADAEIIRATAAEALKENKSEKNAASGYCPLDANVKIPFANIPDSILGQLEYQGVWDASTGTFPTATGSGQYWIASSNGTGSTISYSTGDWAVYNGTTFDKVDNSDAVFSVNGKLGNVVLEKADVGLGNVDNTSDINKPVSTAQQSALDLKANQSSISNVDNTSDANKPVSTAQAAAIAAHADLLTGMHGLPALDHFVYGDTAYGGSIVDNLNTLARTMPFTCLGTAVGAPSSDYSWFGWHINSNAGTTAAKQIAWAYNSSIAICYERVKTSSSWGAWTRSGSPAVINSTATDYTFLASDANSCHLINTSASTTRTVPSDSTAPNILIGDSIEVVNVGTGTVTFAAASGVTLLSSLTLVMYGQYSVCMLRKIAANTWILTGERTAV